MPDSETPVEDTTPTSTMPAEAGTAESAPAAAVPAPRTALDLFQEFGTPVYPGHPVAVACYALLSAPTLAAALVPVGQSGTTLAAAKTVTAAQDAIQATAAMLGRLARGESVEAALKWSGDWWARCIRSHQPAFDKRLEPGLEQARRMEPLFRELVTEARARAAEQLALEPIAPAAGASPTDASAPRS